MLARKNTPRLVPLIAFLGLWTPHDSRAASAPTDPSAPAASAADPENSILRKRRGYLNISPAGVTLWPPCGPGCRANPMYTWGFDAGYHVPGYRRFALQLGGFFTDVATQYFHYISVGPMLRIGGGNERVFGYGLTRIGAQIVHSTYPGHRDTFAGFHASVGAGIMGAVHRRVTLGGEASGDFLAFSSDSFTWVSLRLFVGILF